MEDDSSFSIMPFMILELFRNESAFIPIVINYNQTIKLPHDSNAIVFEGICGKLWLFVQYGYNLNIQSFIFMDEAQLRELIPPKQQNPLLKRKPLNLGNKFTVLSKQEESVQFQNTLNQPHITLLFFAAEWCNVCKSFIPFLKKFYEEVNLESKRIQIIYVGLDKVKKDYEQFTKTMPWIGLPFADQRISGLKQFYDIRAIPKLLLLDIRGEQVKNNCRQDVYNLKQDDAFEKWSTLKTSQQKSYFYS